LRLSGDTDEKRLGVESARGIVWEKGIAPWQSERAMSKGGWPFQGH